MFTESDNFLASELYSSPIYYSQRNKGACYNFGTTTLSITMPEEKVTYLANLEAFYRLVIFLARFSLKVT